MNIDGKTWPNDAALLTVVQKRPMDYPMSFEELDLANQGVDLEEGFGGFWWS